MVRGRFELDPIDGSEVKNAVLDEAERLRRQDLDTGNTRTATQRRADALVNLIRRGAGSKNPAKPLVHLVMSAKVFADWVATGTANLDVDDVDGRCETVEGTPIHPQRALEVLLRAEIRRLVLGPDDEILNLGRRRPLLPAASQSRDHCCWEGSLRHTRLPRRHPLAPSRPHPPLEPRRRNEHQQRPAPLRPRQRPQIRHTTPTTKGVKLIPRGLTPRYQLHSRGIVRLAPCLTAPESRRRKRMTRTRPWPRFSANLGFLWTHLSLPDAIGAAAAAGFDGVECHFPYQWQPADVLAALADTGLPMISLNTALGSEEGDAGLAAVPGREAEARDLISQAIEYAGAIGCPNVHVMAGCAGTDETYQDNIAFAAGQGARHGVNILFEPISTSPAGGYHLQRVDHGVAIVDAVNAPNVKLMVDCFHAMRMEGDVVEPIRRAMPHLGHVQFAAYPDRGEPTQGDVDYRTVLPAIRQLGYNGMFGAEYAPRGATVEEGLAWMNQLRDQP